MGIRRRSTKPESPVQDQHDPAAFAEDEADEFVTMATVRELLKVQESMLKTLFESVVQSLTTRVDEVVKSLETIKTSLEFTQNNVQELKPVQAELVKTNKEIERLNIWKTKVVVITSGLTESWSLHVNLGVRRRRK